MVVDSAPASPFSLLFSVSLLQTQPHNFAQMPEQQKLLCQHPGFRLPASAASCNSLTVCSKILILSSSVASRWFNASFSFTASSPPPKAPIPGTPLGKPFVTQNLQVSNATVLHWQISNRFSGWTEDRLGWLIGAAQTSLERQLEGLLPRLDQLALHAACANRKPPYSTLYVHMSSRQKLTRD